MRAAETVQPARALTAKVYPLTLQTAGAATIGNWSLGKSIEVHGLPFGLAVTLDKIGYYVRFARCSSGGARCRGVPDRRFGFRMTPAPTIDLGHVARDLHLPPDHVQRTVELLDEGNTVPFITRYRK